MDASNMLHLPQEILVDIFSYLCVDDLLTSSLVCRQWLNAADCPALLQNICVKVERICFDVAQPCFTRKFTNFAFKEIEISLQHLTFLDEYGEHIRYLRFSNCRIQNKIIESLRKKDYCRNLNSLSFENCFFNLFSILPEIKSLSLIDTDNEITDRILSEFGKTMPNLQKLVLYQRVASETAVIKRFYPDMNAISESPSDLILTLPALIDFIDKRSRTLSHLQMDRSIWDVPILMLFKIKNLRLKCLSMSLREKIIPTVCQFQSSLTDLSFGLLQLDDDVVKLICSLLPTLESLNLQGNVLLNSGIEDIFQLKFLRKLNILACGAVKKESFKNALRVFKLNDLRELDLGFTKLDDEVLTVLLKQTSKLKYLNLKFCSISDETVLVISEYQVLLRYLSLTGCTQITDNGLLCPHNENKCISNIKGLLELRLDSCPKLTAKGLLRAVTFLELRTFSASPVAFTYEERRKLQTENPSLKFPTNYI